ncbi:MAG TPA: DUF92 domain-containing protein [Thermomicrobiales bacterium]|nr:DUF92 domain-containing protein [Thermomicrobiales bacterium]
MADRGTAESGVRDAARAAGGGWPSARAVAAGALASAAIGAAAYRRESLTCGGVAGALLVGTMVFAAGGPRPAAQLVAFFVSSSALSHWRRERKRAAAVEVAKGGRRDFRQVLANGGVAAALAAVGRRWPAAPWRDALLGALATVDADTWATELGLLSARPPRLVTTLRAVPAGTSGGVTLAGALAAAGGAGAIGLVAAIGPRGRSRPAAVALAVVAGVAGAFADSVLGATLQARYRCPRCGALTERTRHCDAPTVLVGGLRWLDNDAVNLASSAIGAATGWLAGRVLRAG